MNHFFLVPILIVVASAAIAGEWRLRSGDVPLDPAETRDLANRGDIVFYDDGRSRYFADGRYSYTYSAKNGGGTALGTYAIQDDGSVCVQYPNGFDRCDLYVRSGDRLVLITEDGTRFPVRPGPAKDAD
ncbi:MAG: hypothetical protein ACWA5A_15365 [Marinibacterium sp.]